MDWIFCRPSTAGLIDEHALPIVTPRGAMKAKDQAAELPTPLGSVPELLKDSRVAENGSVAEVLRGSEHVETGSGPECLESPFAKHPAGGKTADAAKAGCQCTIC